MPMPSNPPEEFKVEEQTISNNEPTNEPSSENSKPSENSKNSLKCGLHMNNMNINMN